MKENMEKVLYTKSFIAEDGTEFKVIAEDKTRPTKEEINRARIECAKYEATSSSIVLKKLLDSGSVLAGNFFKHDKVVNEAKIKVVGSADQSYHEESFSIGLPTFFLDLFKIDYRNPFFIFTPKTRDDLDLFYQYFNLGNFRVDSDCYCSTYPDNMKTNKTYYVSFTHPDQSLFGTRLMKIIDHDEIKKQLDKALDELNKNLDMYKNPKDYVFDVNTAEIRKGK